MEEWRRMLGRIFEIREFTLHDGPGPRTTVFLQGCPLRCTWCHNPEGQEFGAGREMTDEEVAAEVLKNADFLVMSKSGVTLSGGEPLAQAGFAAAIIDSIRAKEPRLTHVIETSGFASDAIFEDAMARCDLIMMDWKVSDPALHKRYTGADQAVIRRHAQMLYSLLQHCL